MKLLELFGSKPGIDVKWSKRRASYAGYKTELIGNFTTPNGESIVIKCLEKQFDKIWEFHFENVRTGKNPNGLGDQFLIYSTVIDAVRELILDRKPNTIELYGNTKKQCELYKRMVQRFLPELDSLGYEPEHDEVDPDCVLISRRR